MRKLFLALLEGSTPSSARPLLASEDPELIRAVAQEIQRRLGGDGGQANPRAAPGEESGE